MKAKVIATQEVVDVVGVCYDTYHCKHSNGDESWLLKMELEFLVGNHIDWEQRRFELVKAIVPQCAKMIENALFRGAKSDDWKCKTAMEITAETAILYADAVIEKLKEE